MLNNENMNAIETRTEEISLSERFENIKDNNAVWVPKQGETIDERSQVFNALNASSENLGNHLNEVIRITNMVMRGRGLTDKDTGEYKDILEVLFVADDGTIYRSSSTGIIRSVEGLLSVVGGPECWGEGLNIRVKSIPTSKGHTYLFELV